ncbi:hypothetical protein SCHPADRAFT_1003086 [Schizopora paradoxa]|uniref:F-box domain-containing protein n=1 Tax=Schizopora paradoxa TaxID=27342 RepID=A0A0H2R6D8_9AGAM|nr:hypothetical protein SCHPADRAFT_1003086 [Schizopora paradoxa]
MNSALQSTQNSSPRLLDADVLTSSPEPVNGVPDNCTGELYRRMLDLTYHAGRVKMELALVNNFAEMVTIDAEIVELHEPGPCYYPDLKAALEDMRDTRLLVATVVNNIDLAIRNLESQTSKIFIQGNFARFPDEIFGMIFEFAGFGDLRSAINISRVCRRFRNIALSTPLLWSRIHLRGRWIEEAKARADRTRSSMPSLSLVIDARSGHHPRDTLYSDYRLVILDFVCDHALRITSLEMDLEYLYDGHSSWSEYSTITLPYLVYMKLSAFYSEFSDTDAFAQREELWQEYRDWNMPMLRTLHSVNMFPDFPANVLSKIKTYRLEIRKEYDDSYLHWTLSSLAGYLSQMTSIEDLTISSLNLMDEHFPPEDIPKVQMVSLRRLSLKFSDYRKTHFKHFFDAFESGNLRSLSINVPSECIPDLEQWSEELWNVHRFPTLTDVRFVIRPLFNVGELRSDPRLTILDRFLAAFPKLQDIYFECVSDESHPFSFSNSLCAMHFKNCNLLDRWDQQWWISYCKSAYRKTHGEELDRCLILDGADRGAYGRTPVIEKTANSIQDINLWREAFVE